MVIYTLSELFIVQHLKQYLELFHTTYLFNINLFNIYFT